MIHTSKLFGEFQYVADKVITFPHALLGFQNFTKFVVKRKPATDPLRWLLSVEEDGPDFAIVEPELLDERFSISRMDIGRETLSKLGASSDDDLKLYAVVTVPEDIRRISMNLRAPLLICPKTRLALQRLEPETKNRSVRRPIYRELTGDVIHEKLGQLMLHRKVNETIQVGDDILIEIMGIENGGVRLGVTAPKDVRIARGDDRADPELQMIEAARHIDVEGLVALLSGRYTGESSQTS